MLIYKILGSGRQYCSFEYGKVPLEQKHIIIAFRRDDQYVDPQGEAAAAGVEVLLLWLVRKQA